MTLFLLLSATAAAIATRNVVLMHGLLADSSALDTLKTWIQQDFPGFVVQSSMRHILTQPLVLCCACSVYVKSLSFCQGVDSLFTNMNLQVEMFAREVQSDPVVCCALCCVWFV